MDYVSSVDSFTDFSGLDRLKVKGKQGEEGSIQEVARQLESLFLNQLLKSMRQANEGFSEGSFLSSNQTKMYDQMLDSQLSVSLTKGAGIGLADTIIKQLSSTQGGSPEKAVTDLNQKPVSDMRRLTLDARKVSASSDTEYPLINANIAAQTAAQTSNRPESAVTDILKVPTTPDEFIQWVYPHAVEAAKELGVSPKVLVAQSALETGWGQKPIVTAEGRNSNNLFGIKADHRWPGENTSITTLEYREGIAKKERANFRVYDTVKESLQDYVQFLKTNPRYQQALEKVNDPKAFSQSLMDAGYATDPKYAEKIMGIFDGKLLNRMIGAMES